MRAPLRLGSIEFINSLPVDLGLLSGAVPLDAKIIQGPPMALNQKIIRSELDISPVSALWYAEHEKELLLLPDLSISSESGVQSVLLFSRLKLGNFAGATIALTDKGYTTPALLEVLCRLKYGFRPRFKEYPALEDSIPEDSDAMLLIGDEALMMREKLKGAQIEVIDLAEEWRQWTHKPFVFAVWAVRREFFLSYPDEVLKAHRAILESKRWGLEHLEEVLRKGVEKTELPKEALRSYFMKLSYSFDETMKEGLELYLQYAVRCGLVAASPPLQFAAEMGTAPFFQGGENRKKGAVPF